MKMASALASATSSAGCPWRGGAWRVDGGEGVAGRWCGDEWIEDGWCMVIRLSDD